MVVYTFFMKRCLICGNSYSSSHPNRCARCNKLIQRGKRLKIKEEVCVKALKDAWNGKGFLCHYSKTCLDEKSPQKPRYITFDHHTPRNANKIVVTAAIINDMKSDMSEEEFRKMVTELANTFRGDSFDEGAFDLKYYKR